MLSTYVVILRTLHYHLYLYIYFHFQSLLLFKYSDLIFITMLLYFWSIFLASINFIFKQLNISLYHNYIIVYNSTSMYNNAITSHAKLITQ